jgi:hypothetical protein
MNLIVLLSNQAAGVVIRCQCVRHPLMQMLGRMPLA